MNTRSLSTMRDEPVNRLCIYIGTCYCHGSHLGSHSRSIAFSFVLVSYVTIRTSLSLPCPFLSHRVRPQFPPASPGAQVHSNISTIGSEHGPFPNASSGGLRLSPFLFAFQPLRFYMDAPLSYFPLTACFLSIFPAYILVTTFLFSL